MMRCRAGPAGLGDADRAVVGPVEDSHEAAESKCARACDDTHIGRQRPRWQALAQHGCAAAEQLQAGTRPKQAPGHGAAVQRRAQADDTAACPGRQTLQDAQRDKSAKAVADELLYAKPVNTFA